MKLLNGSRLPARVATIDKAADVAVLTTDAGGTVTALKLSLEPVSQGDDVIAFVQSTDEEWQTIRGKPGYSFLIPASVIQAELANGLSALKSPPKQ